MNTNEQIRNLEIRKERNHQDMQQNIKLARFPSKLGVQGRGGHEKTTLVKKTAGFSVDLKVLKNNTV